MSILSVTQKHVKQEGPHVQLKWSHVWCVRVI